MFSSTSSNPIDIEFVQKRIPGGDRTQAFAASAFSPDTLTYTVVVDRELFTFNDPTKDIGLDPANSDPRGIWSSERTMWVDGGGGKLYAYNMWTNNVQPPGVGRKSRYDQGIDLEIRKRCFPPRAARKRE